LLARSGKLDNFFGLLSEIERNVCRLSRIGFQDMKVLCIEGLPGSGKTTLVKDLVDSVAPGVKFVEAMLPQEVQDVRHVFGYASSTVATAMAFVVNYCVAYQIIRVAEANTSSSSSSSAREPTIVVVDQYYHAACARTVCSRVEEGDLRSLPASAFEWPLDLPPPTLVIYLMAPPECRNRSLMDSPTDESRRKDERLEVAYSLVTGPPTIALDASEAPSVVRAQAIDACEEFGLYVRPKLPSSRARNKRVSMGIYGELPVV
jgi:thymidylate kinase